MGGSVGRGQDVGWLVGGVPRVMRVARATDPLLLRSAAGCLMGGWEHGRRRRSAVLPVAVGHGILSLLLLEELCDGQQLFQHVLHKESERKNKQTNRS